jgi:hypothetical protein
MQIKSAESAGPSAVNCKNTTGRQSFVLRTSTTRGDDLAGGSRFRSGVALMVFDVVAVVISGPRGYGSQVTLLDMAVLL